MYPPVEDALRKANWDAACRQAVGHASLTGASCSAEFRALMQSISQKLLRLPPPRSHRELESRTRRASGHSLLVQSIAHGDRMSRTCPRAQAAIYSEAQKLAAFDLPETEEGSAILHARCSRFSLNVQSLCNRLPYGP